MAPELSLQLIGGRIQMLADQRHGKSRGRRRTHCLVIEGARMYVRVLEYGKESGVSAHNAREHISAIVRMLVQEGQYDVNTEKSVAYMTAACDEDPDLLERIVQEDNPSLDVFSMFCQGIQRVLTKYSEAAGADPLLTFLQVSR